MPKKIFILFLLILSLRTNAQVEFGTARFIKLELENDGTFATDRYYTNGMFFSYHAPRIIGLFHKDKVTQERLTLGQKIFTPSKYDQDVIDFDRPFVSSLTIAYNSEVINPERKLRVRHGIELGIQGEGSGGQAVQNFIHSILPASEEIEDWQYQLGTDVIINYQFNLEKGLINEKHLMISATGSLMAGSPQLAADLGAYFRVGKLFDRFKYEDLAKEGWALFLYAKPVVTLTAYDTLLQGGLLTNDDPFTVERIQHFYYTIRSGVYFTMGRWAIDYGFTYQSRLASELMPHRWAKLDIAYQLN